MSNKWRNDKTGEIVEVTGISKCRNFLSVQTAAGRLEYGWAAFLNQHERVTPDAR